MSTYLSSSTVAAIVTRTLLRTPAMVGRAVAVGVPILLTACPASEVTPPIELPDIDIGNANPQSTPVPTGNATAPNLPQIEIIDAPTNVSPGQVVNVRLGTNFMPSTDVTGVAVDVEGVDGWFKAAANPEPAAVSDGVDWIFPVSVIIADTADPGEQVRIGFALLAAGDEAGGYTSWQPVIASTGTVQCPQDADCSTTACGPDPVCGTYCGACNNGQTCNGDGQCEAIGSACPDIADCSDRECGADPVCGTSCGMCEAGETCNLDGQCIPGDMTCGDGVASGTETCDGNDVGAETCVTQGFDAGTLTCNATCDGFDTSACTYTCGDGNIDPGEGCDDANTDAGDGCDAACTVEAGWQCAGDPSVCTPICGDGNVVGSETCDGANVGTETCATQGFDTGTLACNGTCDGYDTSGCSYVCGDGTIDPGEACDDANTNAGDGCDTTCAIEAGWACTGEPSVCTETCGNGVVDSGEDCDASDLNGATCGTEGFDGGAIACSASCTFDTTACFVCGDGVLNGTETCDGADFGAFDCIGVGYDAGTPTCNATCDAVDYATCTYTCGDNGTDPGEVCDGTDIGTETCVSQGFDDGALACAGDCLGFDTAACTYTCGNGVANGAEVCDGSDLLGADCISQGFAAGTLSCAPDCNAFVTDACITQGEVEPLHPLNGAGWAEWVTSTGQGALATLDEACDPVTADQCTHVALGEVGRGELPCAHAGELRQVVLPYANCSNVVVSDNLGLFDWICDDSLGVARGISTGRKDGVYLSDLIDWNALPIAWKDNFVNYTDGVSPGSTTPGSWWLTPVQTATGGQLPATPGVFVVASNLALPVSFTASSQSLVTRPGVASILGQPNGGVDVVSVNGGSSTDYRAFLWIEATVDAFTNRDAIELGVWSPFSIVENTVVTRVGDTTSTGIRVRAGGATLRDLSLDDVNEGINVTGPCGLMEDVLIVGEGANGYSTFSGVYLNDSNWTVRRLTSVSNARDGMDAQGTRNFVEDSTFANNNENGLTFNGTSSIGLDVRAYNNTLVGLAGDEGTSSVTTNNHVQRFISAGNRTGVVTMSGASLGIVVANDQRGSSLDLLHGGVTAANNGDEGFYRTQHVLNGLALNNFQSGFTMNGSGYYSDLAALYNDESASTAYSDIREEGTNIFSGRMLVTDSTNTSTNSTSNGSCEATQTDPFGTGQGFDDTCTPNPNTASDHVLTSGPGVPGIVSSAAADTTNTSDDNGTDMQGPGRANFDNITDWYEFDNQYRGWGEFSSAPLGDVANTAAGRCSTAGEDCAIWDWRISTGDTVVRNALASELPLDGTTDARAEVLEALTSQTICERLGAVWDSPIAGQCSITFLRRAVEILGDGVGNENTFCESGEDCIRLAHIGGYQGTGNLVQVQTIGTGGTIENVNLFEYDSW